MTEPTTAETLNRAADLIEEYGWSQGGWGLAYNGQPVLPVCAEGAILAAAGEGERFREAMNGSGGNGHSPAARTVVWLCPATRAVIAYLDDADITDWNDAPDRTASEVIETLRACAVIEESREHQAVEVSA